VARDRIHPAEGEPNQYAYPQLGNPRVRGCPLLTFTAQGEPEQALKDTIARNFHAIAFCSDHKLLIFVGNQANVQRLRKNAAEYLDAIGVAAESVIGPANLTRMEHTVESMAPD
jgi:hypothetical protein